MPPGADKYALDEKYYPYKNEYSYKSDYYTIDKNIYDEIVHLNKLYKSENILGWSALLWIIPLILFGALNLWLLFLFSFIGVISHIIAVGIFETNLNTKYFDLWQKFTNTEEFRYQKEQEELYAELEHQNKIYNETKELVEMYNILNNKKMSKETKIKRLIKCIDKNKNLNLIGCVIDEHAAFGWDSEELKEKLKKIKNMIDGEK